MKGSSPYTRYAPDSAGEGTRSSELSSIPGSSLQPVLAIISGTVDSPIVLGNHGFDLVSGACADHGGDASSNACSSILMEFPHGSNHHLSYHLVYTANVTYLGTIARLETSFIYEQRNVANP